MPITIKLFAVYSELLGQREVEVPSHPGLTVSDLFAEIIGGSAHESLRRSTLFAINEAYVPPETLVRDGDRVAFIPPVSGG